LRIIQIAPTILQFELIGYLPRRVSKIYVRSENCKRKLLETDQYNDSHVEIYSVEKQLMPKPNVEKCILLVFEQIRDQVNPKIMEYWEKIIKTVQLHGRTVIRLHPKQSLNKLTEHDILSKIKNDRIEISKSKNLIGDFRKAFCVIGTNTSVLAEAEQIGLPVAQIMETKIENYGNVTEVSIADIGKFVCMSLEQNNLTNTQNDKLLDEVLIAEK
jgi:hypothetical protein